MKFITLTTDLGLKDHYVAALKASIYEAVEGVQVIDITHNVVPFDVGEAAFHLSQAIHHFPEGTVHVVGVDAEPIVNFGNAEGAFPSIMAIEEQYIVANDNGFFGALQSKQKTKFYRIDDALSSPKGMRFPTKNLLLPTAIQLASGAKIENLASPQKDFKKAFSYQPIIEPNVIKGHIVHLDAFGNAITNIHKELFDKIGQGAPFVIKIRTGENYQISEISNSYNEVSDGEKLALFNDGNLLEIAINRGANESTGGAEQLFGLRKSDVIRVEFLPRGSRETIESLF